MIFYKRAEKSIFVGREKTYWGWSQKDCR